ncbi:Reverse transcriptase zinc-binding domain, partial [Sesbania bispinosa]
SGIKWILGNGHQARFWTDAWLQPGVFLKDFLLVELLENELSLPVAHFVSENGEWIYSLFENLLPKFMFDLVIQYGPPSPSNVEDYPSWAAFFDGNFNVRLAFNLLVNEPDNQYSPFWKKFWKWPEPPRVKCFLWKVLKNGSMTNSARCHRGFAEFDRCPICGGMEEVPLHALRDCFNVKEIWLQLLPTWCIWQERNNKVFTDKLRQSFELAHKIKSLIAEFSSNDSKVAVSLIEQGCHSNHPCFGLISEIQALMGREWEIYDSPPPGCGEILVQDLIRVLFPRRVVV